MFLRDQKNKVSRQREKKEFLEEGTPTEIKGKLFYD